MAKFNYKRARRWLDSVGWLSGLESSAHTQTRTLLVMLDEVYDEAVNTTRATFCNCQTVECPDGGIKPHATAKECAVALSEEGDRMCEIGAAQARRDAFFVAGGIVARTPWWTGEQDDDGRPIARPANEFAIEVTERLRAKAEEE